MVLRHHRGSVRRGLLTPLFLPAPTRRRRPAFDAIGEFAVDYADQNERAYRGFVRAVKEGRIQATADI